jgi:hypothetical protein
MEGVLKAVAAGRHVPALGAAQRPMFVTYCIDEAQCITPDAGVDRNSMPYGSGCWLCVESLLLSLYCTWF